MNTKTVWDSFKAESENVVEKVKELGAAKATSAV
jgi:hypothetical protein